MAMLLHVGAKPRGAALNLDLAQETAFYEGVQAIINRRMGNIGHLPLGADKDLLGGGMIALLQQNVIDLLALRRQSQATGAQPFGETLIQFIPSRVHQ
jgi:hypothetical protein